MTDRILARMPDRFDYFLPAMSAVHSYAAQLHTQGRYGYSFTIECGHESHLFFGSSFPRMEVTVRTEEVIYRKDWDCVLDLRDVDRALRMATPTHKHLVEIWGIQVGSAPTRLPTLGLLASRAHTPEVDVLLDTWVDGHEIVEEWLLKNFPDIKVRVQAVQDKRPSGMFNALAQTRLYVGPRSGTTYLAATMHKGVVEICTPTELPVWFLHKPSSEGYRSVCSEVVSAALLWPFLEEIVSPMMAKEVVLV